MDDAERQRRKEEIVEKVRSEQNRLGHDGPLPAFLNLITDHMVDMEARMQKLEKRVRELRKNGG